VFAHIETVGAIGDNGLPLKMKEDTLIRQPGDFVISGHIHQYQHLKKKRLVYCGSPYQKNFGESLPKGFIEFEAKYVSGDLKVSHTFVNSKPGFTLETVIVKQEDDWNLLNDDPSRRYKVLVDRAEVVIPKNLTTRYPNIVMINGIDTTTKVEMNRDGTEDTVTSKNLPKISMRTGLVSYLKNSGLSRAQRDMGRELVEQAISSGVV
jgi:DNA repair exonuclease SbcCD nuclease subunit